MKFMSVVIFTILAMPGIGHTQSKAIELPKLIEAFMVDSGSSPQWEMGAGKSMLQIKWISSGVESQPSCGSYLSCRRGTARVLLNGKEMQHLRQRLEPVLWEIFMTSNSPAKLGPEEVSISPSCDTVQCEFDFKKAMSVKDFSLKKICEAGPASLRQTAYEVHKGTARVYAVVTDNLGSGGASTELSLFFSTPSPASDLCAEAEEEPFSDTAYATDQDDIDKDLQEFQFSLLRNDQSILIKKTYPPVVAEMGGQEVLLKQAKMVMDLPEIKSMKFEKHVYLKPYRLGKGKNNTYAVIPYNTQVEIQGQRLEQRGCLLGIKADMTKEWTYVSADKMDNKVFFHFFPDFPQKLNMCTFQQRFIP